MGELKLGLPVSGAEVTSIFNEARPAGRKHGGVDYAAPENTPVKSSESGKVIFASRDIPGYGNLIIINHTPKAGSRHIYTLYAHLDCMSVRNGDYVLKNVTIGGVGHTGYSTSRPENKPDHLHFEVFDAKWRVTVGEMIQKGGSARQWRVDPAGYIGRLITINGTIQDMVEQAIIDRIDLVPDIDFARTEPLRMQVWLDGRNLGDMKNISSIAANLNYDLKSELRRI